MKNKDIHIRVSDEQLEIVEKLAKKDRIKKSQVLERAIENYFKLRKMQ